MEFLKHLWPVYARRYDALVETPLYRELLTQVFEELQLAPNMAVLDAGCGTGNLSELLASSSRSARVFALDRSKEMLEIAVQKVDSRNVSFHRADLVSALPLRSSCFERAVMLHVLYALKRPTATLREINRIMVLGGTLIIANPKEDASLGKVLAANIAEMALIEKFAFLARTSIIIAINAVITAAGARGSLNFWSLRQLERELELTGFSLLKSVRTYGEQDYLIVAVKCRDVSYEA